MEHVMSLEEQMIEYAKCCKDPVYFMRKYCFIQHPLKGKIKFNLFDFQERALSFIRDHRLAGILKGRQLGISTLIAGYCLWLMLFHDDKNILVIAISQKTAKNLVLKVREMVKLLPSFLTVETESWNLTSIRFKNGSQIQAATASPDSARSEALSLLIMDEAAFLDNDYSIWTGASSTLGTGGQAIMLSTPNGTSGLFYDKYVDFIEGKKGAFQFIKLPWYLHPDRDQEWRDNEDMRVGKRNAAQENDCDFLASGNTMVDPDDLKYHEINLMEPIEKRYFDMLHIFKAPEQGKNYIIPADVARGDGSDYSAFHIIDVETSEQVAEFKGQVGTTEYAQILMECGFEWNTAMLIIENLNIGWAVVQDCINADYPQLFYTGAHIGTEKDLYISDDKKVAGFTTSLKTRPLILSKLEETYRAREKGLIVRGNRTANEMKVFVWKNGKLSAQQGKNDDLVMSLAIGIWVRETSMVLLKQSTEMTQVMLNNISRTSNFTPNNKLNSVNNDGVFGSRYIKGGKGINGASDYERMKKDPTINWIL